MSVHKWLSTLAVAIMPLVVVQSPAPAEEVVVHDAAGDASASEHDYVRAVYRNSGSRIAVVVTAPNLERTTTGWLNVRMSTPNFEDLYYVRIVRRTGGGERLRLFDESSHRVRCGRLAGGFALARHEIAIRLPRSCLPTRRRGGWDIEAFGGPLGITHADDSVPARWVPYGERRGGAATIARGGTSKARAIRTFNRVLDSVQAGDRSQLGDRRLISRGDWRMLRTRFEDHPTRASDCRWQRDSDGVRIVDCAVVESDTQTNFFAYMYRSPRTVTGWRVGAVYFDVF